MSAKKVALAEGLSLAKATSMPIRKTTCRDSLGQGPERARRIVPLSVFSTKQDIQRGVGLFQSLDIDSDTQGKIQTRINK